MKKISETELNRKLCGSCTKCCEYVNIKINTPKTEDAFDHILWYLIHRNVYIWISKKDDWYVRFNTPCKPLSKGICMEYKTRPMLCREYSQKICERHDSTKDEKYAFHSRKELLSYLKKNKKRFFGFYE